MAYKNTGKKNGRPRETYSYDLAKQVVQSQGITSKRDFERWWNTNLPKGIPKQPHTLYKRERGQFSWSDFLGIDNGFPIPRTAFRSYEDCKKFVYTLGLRNSLEWFKFVKEKKIPEDIPKAPMHHYRNKGEWISWKDFLGYDLAKRHDFLVTTKKPMLFIAKTPNRPANVFRMNIIMGEKQDLIDYSQRTGVRFIRCFYLNRHDDNWLGIVERYLSKYPHGEDDEYFSSNVSEVVSELSYSFEAIT